MHVADPPRITNHPLDLKDAIQGKDVKFNVQATGAEPLNYQWEWKAAEEKGGSKTWQRCRVDWADGNTLTIPSVRKLFEGSYRCVINNCAGIQISNQAELQVS